MLGVPVYLLGPLPIRYCSGVADTLITSEEVLPCKVQGIFIAQGDFHLTNSRAHVGASYKHQVLQALSYKWPVTSAPLASSHQPSGLIASMHIADRAHCGPHATHLNHPHIHDGAVCGHAPEAPGLRVCIFTAKVLRVKQKVTTRHLTAWTPLGASAVGTA